MTTTRLTRGAFIRAVAAAMDADAGFAVGKIGHSEQFQLYSPILATNYPDPRQRRAIAVALGYHGGTQTGIFPADPDFVARYLDFYVGRLRALDALGLFGAPAEAAILAHHRLDVPTMDFLDQEPGRGRPDDPADCYLPLFAGRRVLIVSPFAPLLARRATRDVFEAVWAKTGKRWFAPASVEAMVMPYGWDAGTRARHGNSLALLEQLEAELASRRFDVALISGGGLGIPLAVRAKAMGAVGIALGGHLQVLFGVLGARWRNDPAWRCDYINDAWIDLPPALLPSEPLERLTDGGAYW